MTSRTTSEAPALPVQTYSESTLPEIKDTEADPFIDACPLWCMSAADGHRVAAMEDDRTHVSDDVAVPIRSMTMERDDRTVTPGAVVMYLRRNYRNRDARISFEHGASTIRVTLDEAETIARSLLALVERAR